ncbi:hypothetical protein AYR62_00185 [Secundilactobacillus paracollinoides]|uniref:DegV family protein n=1 Tax=Secundilactobacillus paracollinoides TaxID=240427 RepID=UPI00081A5D8B|nr:DegV family protein [Secundilactobacillus paracollinoides]ANZ62671.1 hypothetical protein AYR62_00185 [Secundilactobacillus paracollinoides]
MAIAIITDSTAYLSTQFIHDHHNLFIAPVPVLWHGKTYTDMVDITPDTFYPELATSADMPSTSMPSLGTMTELLDKAQEAGYDDVVIIPMSKGISSFADTLHELDDRTAPRVHLFDTNSTAGGNNLLVSLAVQLADEQFSINEVLQGLTTLRDSMTIEFVVKDLPHLQRTGRISNTARILGSLLHVCPVLTMDVHGNGKITPMAKERTERRALDDIQRIMNANTELPYAAVVFDGNHATAKARWVDQLKTKFPDLAIDTSFIGPAIGCHTGSGVLGIAWAYDAQAIINQLKAQH